jgi:hypothetical protein
VGQALGAFFTLLAVWFAVSVERKAEERRRQETEARETLRARLVTVYQEAAEVEPYRIVRFRNDSATVIFNVRLDDLRTPDGGVLHWRIREATSMDGPRSTPTQRWTWSSPGALVSGWWRTGTPLVTVFRSPRRS